MIMSETWEPKENDCNTCHYAQMSGVDDPCYHCIRETESSMWQASDLYDAYLREKERAERFRQALNCPECCGKGNLKIAYSDRSGIEHRPCPKCAEIRKEARGGDV